MLGLSWYYLELGFNNLYAILVCDSLSCLTRLLLTRTLLTVMCLISILYVILVCKSKCTFQGTVFHTILFALLFLPPKLAILLIG